MFVDRFFEMEENCHLFDFKSEEGFPVWDLFRYDIYLKYTFPPITHVKQKTHEIAFIYFVGVVRIFLSIFPLLFKKADNLIFPNARYLDEKGLLFDKASENIIEQLKDDLIIIENFKALKKYRHTTEFNFVSIYSAFWGKKKQLSADVASQIQQALLRTFKESKVNADDLDRMYSKFYNEYLYYRLLFKLKKAKKVYFVQTGIQKGMVAAARSLGIEIVELQHGFFGKDHLAYSYPSSINPSSNICYPDKLFTMGKLWGRELNVPTKIVVVGNDSFSQTVSFEPKDNSILVVSSIIHGKLLSDIVLSFAEKYPHIKINFKLHPNEFRDFRRYLDVFSENPNVQVLQREININSLIARSSLVLLINSTALYETLNQGEKVAIYRKMNYDSQSDCFLLPNVYLIDTVDDIYQAYSAKTEQSDSMFFERFDVAAFSKA